jgi:hypothetical protein
MNVVTIVGTVDDFLAEGPITSMKLAVPRWGPTGREPGVLYVFVRVLGVLELQAGDVIGVTGWLENAGERFEIECVKHMVTVLKAQPRE